MCTEAVRASVTERDFALGSLGLSPVLCPLSPQPPEKNTTLIFIGNLHHSPCFVNKRNKFQVIWGSCFRSHEKGQRWIYLLLESRVTIEFMKPFRTFLRMQRATPLIIMA